MWETLGEHGQLKKLSQKFRVRVKVDPKETGQNSESASKRSASVTSQKFLNQNKNVDRKIYKRIWFSMLKALKTKVDEAFSNSVSPNGNLLWFI